MSAKQNIVILSRAHQNKKYISSESTRHERAFIFPDTISVKIFKITPTFFVKYQVG